MRDIIAKLERKWCPHKLYKHLYYVFVLVSNFHVDRDLFIYMPTFGFNEVKRIIESGDLEHASDRMT